LKTSTSDGSGLPTQTPPSGQGSIGGEEGKEGESGGKGAPEAAAAAAATAAKTAPVAAGGRSHEKTDTPAGDAPQRISSPLFFFFHSSCGRKKSSFTVAVVIPSLLGFFAAFFLW
jgi:hypothetical protein